MADNPAPTGLKPKSKNQRLLLFGGLAVGGVAGLLWWRSSKNAASSAANVTGQSGIDPNTGVPYSQESIDPNTGIPYADESSYGAYGNTPGALGTYNPLTGQYTPGYGTPPSVSVPGTNAQWAQAAEATLVADGYDPATVAVALGLYLAGQPLTNDEYNIVQAAIGFEGQPPVSVPAPHQIPATGNSGWGSTGSGNTHPAPHPIGPAQPVQQLPPSVTMPPVPIIPAVRKFFTVQQWSPSNVANSTLSGIANQSGISLAQIEALNPGITNPNLIYPGQTVRVA